MKNSDLPAEEEEHKPYPVQEEDILTAPDDDFAEIKYSATFRQHFLQPSPNEYKNASIVGEGRVLFHIKGNAYRLVVAIDYEFQVIFVRFIGTHKQYDKIDVKTI